MRLEDVGDYFALRRIAANPWETVRFRETRRPGQTLAVRLRDGALLLLRDEYRLARLPARLGCVVDLGANVGLFAARIASRAERVVCYEPVPANVAIHREAVASEAEALRIYQPESDALSGLHSAFADVSAHMTARYDEMPARSLDEVFARDATLARVARIHGEYHDVAPDDPRTRIDAFAKFLRARGYAVEAVPHPRKPNLGLFFAARPELAR